jgi:tRNA pseudouridine38-40 synthase
MEGARDLLEEVVAKADGPLKSRPRACSTPLPDDLGACRGPAGAGHRYRGRAYHGWQSQPGRAHRAGPRRGRPVGLRRQRVALLCAGRTDAGVHAVNQVVHVDAPVERDPFSWVRGTNRFLPADIAVQWCRPVALTSTPATARADGAMPRGAGVAVRPALEQGWRAGCSGRWMATRCARPPPA